MQQEELNSSRQIRIWMIAHLRHGQRLSKGRSSYLMKLANRAGEIAPDSSFLLREIAKNLKYTLKREIIKTSICKTLKKSNQSMSFQ